MRRYELHCKLCGRKIVEKGKVVRPFRLTSTGVVCEACWEKEKEGLGFTKGFFPKGISVVVEVLEWGRLDIKRRRSDVALA